MQKKTMNSDNAKKKQHIIKIKKLDIIDYMTQCTN